MSGPHFHDVTDPSPFQNPQGVHALEPGVEAGQDLAILSAFLRDVEGLVHESLDVRAGAGTARTQDVMHDEVTDSVPGQQRVIGGTSRFMGVGADLRPLLTSVEGLHRRVDFQDDAFLAGQGLPDHLPHQAVERVQKGGLFESSQIPVEGLEVRQAIHPLLGAQQGLRLQVLEVIQPLDSGEVGVKQHAEDPVEAPAGPACLRVSKAIRKLAVDTQPLEKSSQGIQPAEASGTPEIEDLVKNSACRPSRARVALSHLSGTPSVVGLRLSNEVFTTEGVCFRTATGALFSGFSALRQHHAVFAFPRTARNPG